MPAGYELLYLVPSTKTQEEVKEIIEQVNQLLLKEKAQVLHHEIWQQDRLAYPIKRVEHVFFILCYFTGKSAIPAKIKQDLLLSKVILRSLIVKHDDLVPQIRRFIEKQEPLKVGSAVSGDAIIAGSKKLPRSVIVSQTAVPTEKILSKVSDTSTKLDSAVAVAPTESVADSAVSVEKPEQEGEKEDKKFPKKSTIEELDKKLEDILGGEIEL